MGMWKEWKDVEGGGPFLFGFINGQLIDNKGRKMPVEISEEIKTLCPGVENEDDDESIEVEIFFLSSGYYDSGRTYGDPYYCYPPEGEDCRELKGQISLYYKGVTHMLSKISSEKCFEHFYDEIEKIELRGDNF